MNYDFSNKHLIDLYTKGSSKKFRFINKVLARKFVERVNKIAASNSIYDLYEPPSMEFESLTGYNNRFSIRIDQKYRLEFEIKFTDTEKTMGEVLIVNVSKHYE